MSRHTPGPWEVEYWPKSKDVYCIKANELPVCWGYCEDFGALLSPITEANARLIAAAPDLLEALELIVNANEPPPDWVWQKAEAAVRKAKGEKV